MITKENLGIDRFSPSSLDCYESCPKLFYYTYWLGLKIPEGQDKRHLQFGTAIHAALDEIYLQYDNHFGGGWSAGNISRSIGKFKEQFKINHISDDEFERVKKTKKGSEWESKEDLFNSMYLDGVEMLEEYWRQKEFLLTEYGIDVVKTEIVVKGFFENPVKKGEFLPIPASMRLDGRARDKSIIEFKTSGQKYNVEETKKKIQGLSYAFSVYQEEGFVPKTTYIVLLKNIPMESSKERIQVIPLEYNEQDMLAYYPRVEKIIQDIYNREFSRPMLGHMPYCDCIKFDEALKITK